MVTGVINGFMKVSGQYCLKLLSYDTSKVFFEELKKVSPAKLNHIWGKRRQQKLRLSLIFNMTIQFSVISKMGELEQNLKFLNFDMSTLLSSDFRLRVKL